MKAKNIAALLIGLGFEVVLFINPDWLPPMGPTTKNLAAAVGVALIAMGCLFTLYERTGFNPRRIWFSIKPYGIAVHYRNFLNIGGCVDDLRLVMLIAHLQNKTCRDITKIGGQLLDLQTGIARPIFINIDGELHPPAQINFIPKGAKFRVMVPFGPQHGTGITQNDHPRVEVALQRIGDLVLQLELDTWRIHKRFSKKAVRKEGNKILDSIRLQQQSQNKPSPIRT